MVIVMNTARTPETSMANNEFQNDCNVVLPWRHLLNRHGNKLQYRTVMISCLFVLFRYDDNRRKLSK